MEIGRRSAVGGHGDVTANVCIGNFTSIGPFVDMHQRIQHPCIAHPDLVSTAVLAGYPAPEIRKTITIGHDVWIGRNVVLLGGITIGHGAIIGACSVVAKDVPPYAVVIGNPAFVKRYRFDDETIATLLDIAWWDWPDEVVAERAADLRDVRVLVAKYAYGQAD